MPIEIQRRRPPADHEPGKEALRLVAGFEGLSLKAYPDPASLRARTGAGPGDPWTIGYGRILGVKEGDTCTLAQADEWLMEDLRTAANIVKRQISVPLTSGEFSALTSIAYNLGYIPRTMKAALNGGVGDKGEVYPAGSYGSALKQFPRSCRAAGIPLRGLLRRRMAEACVFSDLPWEAACSKNVINLKLDAKGNIDPNETTSLEDVLARARQDVPILRPDVSDVLKRPWPSVTDTMPEIPPLKTETIIIDKLPDRPFDLPQWEMEVDVALTPTPAEIELQASVEAQAKTGAVESGLPPNPNPAPHANSESAASSGGSGSATATVAGPASAPVELPKTAPQVAPPPPRLPDPPIPVGQQTSAVDATRKSEDWSESAKSMIYSRRFWGLALVVVGRLWMLKTGSNAVLGAVSDPIVTEMFSGFMVMIIGEVVQHWGARKATRPLK